MDFNLNGYPTQKNGKRGQILLIPVQQAEGTWVYEYRVWVHSIPLREKLSKGCTFHSPNEARVAALVAAKTISNSLTRTNELETSPAS